VQHTIVQAFRLTKWRVEPPQPNDGVPGLVNHGIGTPEQFGRIPLSGVCLFQIIAPKPSHSAAYLLSSSSRSGALAIIVPSRCHFAMNRYREPSYPMRGTSWAAWWGVWGVLVDRELRIVCRVVSCWYSRVLVLPVMCRLWATPACPVCRRPCRCAVPCPTESGPAPSDSPAVAGVVVFTERAPGTRWG